MQQNEKGSKSYLFGIVLVAVLGGLLFGYDTAVISGAEKGLQAFFKGADGFVYTDFMHGFTSSSALIGCIIGSALSGLFATRFGRKRSLIFAGICFFLSAWGSMSPETGILAYGEPSMTLLVVFNLYRVLGGIGVGMASAICPMYIGEVAPANIRGMLVSWNQFAIIFGQLVVYFVNLVILGSHANPIYDAVSGAIMNLTEAQWTIETGWRYMFGSEMVPAGLFTLLICFVPETPRYLAMTGQDEKALHVLSRINGYSKAVDILDNIKNTVAEKREKLFAYGFIDADRHHGHREHHLHPRGSVHRREAGPQTAAHHRLARHGHRSLRRGCDLRQRSPQHRHHAQHHGLFRLLYVLLGSHLLGIYLRALPQHHPWRCHRHCCGLPVDLQLRRKGLDGIICVIAALFVWKLVPETKGKSLEDMSRLWRERNKK